jgi:hypothetical protein
MFRPFRVRPFTAIRHLVDRKKLKRDQEESIIHFAVQSPPFRSGKGLFIPMKWDLDKLLFFKWIQYNENRVINQVFYLGNKGILSFNHKGRKLLLIA